MTRSTSATLPDASEKHLSSYASAALAGIGVLTGAQVADAQIVTTTNAGQTIVDNGTIDLFAGAGFAVASGPELTLASSFRQSSFESHRAGVENLSVLGSGNGFYFAKDLGKGATISSKAGPFFGAGGGKIGFSAFSASGGFSRGGNFAGSTGYLGFSFKDPNDPAQTDYGWAEITEGDNHNILTLVNAAYDDTGAPILAGQVPEPGSLALLAGGAGCLAAWRLRNRQRKPAADVPAC